MIHQMNQAIGHAFVNHAPIMANHVHNAVIMTLQDRGIPGFMGPTYYQGNQMVFSPIGSAPGTSQIHPQAPADEGIIGAQLINTIASPQFPSVYTNSTPMATCAQGNFMSGYPVGWNPTTALGMPPEFMFPSPSKQPSTSASQPMNQQENASAPQPT